MQNNAADQHEVFCLSAKELKNSGLFEPALEIITSGHAVDPKSASEQIPVSNLLAVALSGKKLIGIGAIKGDRPNYREKISHRSASPIDLSSLELGYVAIHEDYQRQGLSYRVVKALCDNYKGRLFATTDKEAMEKALTAAYFEKRGRRWDGNVGCLSLWIRDKT
jgi:GNAT superfamily N-acetyltransferase